MELKQQFEKTMSESINMALATSVNDQPNVRVVTFAYDKDRAGRVFFTTFRGNQKTKEFEQNSKVSFMPLPMSPEANAQVRVFGTVRKSDISIDEVISIIGEKTHEDASTIKDGADMMDIYEVCFDKAYITVGVTDAQVILV